MHDPHCSDRPPIEVTLGDGTGGGFDWARLDSSDLERVLQTGPKGLVATEADRRLQALGPNVLEEVEPSSALGVLLHQFRSPLIYILLAATAVTLAIAEYIDAGVIAAVLALNAAIGFFQERRAGKAVRSLLGLVAPQAHVVRDGQAHMVEGRQVVPGDLVLLESGGRVPADIRLVSATSLRIDESLLTGESLPVTKHGEATDDRGSVAERKNVAFCGTVVASGRGTGYVVATGGDTELGAIATMVREEEEPETPLQRRMVRFSRVVGISVAASAAAAMAIGITLGEPPSDMFLVGVALAVSAIPEGLPVVFTITLAIGVSRMARRKALIRSLPAVETLGSVTVIGSDKTGTLTENRMTVKKLWAGGVSYGIDGGAVELAEAGRLAVLAGILASEASLEEEEGQVVGHGDPTEVALLVAAHDMGFDPEGEKLRSRVLRDIPFESDLRYAASFRLDEDGPTLFVKGAPERVVEMCTAMATPAGTIPIDQEAVMKAAHTMAGQGLRVLAMAQKRGANPEGPGTAALHGVTFLGLQGMMDPPRRGVAQAVEGCRRSGIRVIMITGDHVGTALAIGDRLGIGGEGGVLSGADIEEMTDDDLIEAVRRVQIYARATPGHKLRVVHALQRHDEVVAVTGDGVNDAPALKASDVGVAMGRSGTDVAREASDMVIADDDFVSIYAAVEAGRVTFDNLASRSGRNGADITIQQRVDMPCPPGPFLGTLGDGTRRKREVKAT